MSLDVGFNPFSEIEFISKHLNELAHKAPVLGECGYFWLRAFLSGRAPDVARHSDVELRWSHTTIITIHFSISS